MKTKLDAESFGQAISMIVQIWAVFKEVMLQAGIGLEFVVWVLEEGKEKFKASILALGEEYQKTLSPPTKAEHVINFDTVPFCPPGLTVAPDGDQIASRVRGKKSISEIKIRLHLDNGQQGDMWVRGNDLKVKLEGQEVYGAQLLDFYLANPDKIPEELKTAGWVFFWGTIFRVSDGLLYVRCLRWRGSEWFSNYSHGLDCGWCSGSPAAVSASTQG